MKRILFPIILLLSINAFADDSALPVSGVATASAVAVADTQKTSTAPPPYQIHKYIGGLFAHSFNPIFKEPGKKVFIEFVNPRLPKDTDDEKTRQAIIELTKTVDMLSGEARQVLAKDRINLVENKAGADVVFQIVGAQISYGHNMQHPITVPYLGIASTTDWDALQHKMKLQKPGATPGVDAGIFFGPVVSLFSGMARAVADHHSDDLVEDTSPIEQRMLLVVEMYIKKNGEFKMEQREWPAVQLKKPSSYLYVKPDQLFSDAVECIYSCRKE